MLVDVAGVVLLTDIFHDAIGKIVKCDRIEKSLSTIVPELGAIGLFGLCEHGGDMARGFGVHT